MHRSILTGIFVFSLSSGAFGSAAAEELSVNPAPPIAMTQAAGAMPTADYSGNQTGAADAAVVEAHLAMWNATPFAALALPRHPAQQTPLRRFASGIISRSSALASSLTRSAMRFIGVPYVFGGTRKTGFDCSGYVQHVFGMHGMHLPRTADAQFDAARHIKRATLAPGDLVFFHTYAPGVSHVGIYLGHSRFIHASSSRGVAVSSLHDRYWAPRYVGAKRVVGT